MELSNKQIPEEIKVKLQKVKELALRGIGGEKEAALQTLQRFADKYGIDVTKLWDEDKKFYTFAVRATDVVMFMQVYAYKFGLPEDLMDNFKVYNYGSKREVCCNLTTADYIEFSMLWEWHKKNYAAERRRMKKLLKTAYIDRYELYPAFRDDKWKSDKKKQRTWEELEAIANLKGAMAGKQYFKQLEQ